MSSPRTPHNRPIQSSHIISRWRQLQLNTYEPPSPQSIRCKPAFHNTFGDMTCWIDPSTTLRLVTQNIQCIKPLADDNKLQSGISNMVSLPNDIPCLTETNVEWRNYGCREGYKDAFTKLYSTSRHIFSSSSEIASSYHKPGDTVTSVTNRWTHHIHLSGEDSTDVGIWSFFNLLGKEHNMIVISCYCVCPRPPPSNIVSAYYQQSCVMESEDESLGLPIDPHHQTIRDLQIFIQSYQQQGFFISLLMDGNQDDLHAFQQQDIPTKVCSLLRFNYDKHIDGSTTTLIESCNLVNIHKLMHGDVPATHKSGSFQIDFAFLSYGAIEFIHRCGVLDFNALFSSDHRSLFLDIDILRLLWYPVQGKVKSLERDLKLNDPRLAEAYQ
jgi:hypothetical protein